METQEKPQAERLFEISWEICNKVGGIYTVITTKAKKTKELYKEYICIGPYIEEQAKKEFEEEEPPKDFQQAFDKLEQQGITAKYGTWLIKGQPKTILIDFYNTKYLANKLKTQLWEKHKIDSISTGWEFEEPMLFSNAAAEIIHELEKKQPRKKTVLQTHEWMTGFTLLFLKEKNTKIGTVFTTHATILGRSIAGNKQDLYGTLGNFNPHEKAKELGVLDKHTTERASAHAADAFTTVSQITEREAEHILEKKPDVLTLNGVDLELFPTIEEASIQHRESKLAVQELLDYLFFPYYTFDTENNITLYLSSRYEYENKGMDIFLHALAKLNEDLKREKTNKTVTAFFFIAMPNNGVKKELLEQKNYYRHIEKYIQKNNKTLSRKLIQSYLESKEPKIKEIFTQEFTEELRKEISRFKKQGTPPICTHNINNEEQDPIINAAKILGLNNKEENPVKIILYPAYLDGADGLFNKQYEEVIQGTQLGVFPSYYEPWGYTPMESAALGIPAITTNLAGFGRYIEEKQHEEHEEKKGLIIIQRDFKHKDKTTQELYEELKKFTNLTHPERVDHKIHAKKLTELVDWKDLIANYIEAHNHALQKTKK